MAWRVRAVSRRGECRVSFRDRMCIAGFEVGQIVTGKQGVFAGYFVRVTLPVGELAEFEPDMLEDLVWLGESDYSPLDALRRTDQMSFDEGALLLCSGLRDDFKESGLTASSGFGYLDGWPHIVFMMDWPPMPIVLD